MCSMEVAKKGKRNSQHRSKDTNFEQVVVKLCKLQNKTELTKRKNKWPYRKNRFYSARVLD